MVGHFATRLEVEARKAGGSLTAAQIRNLAQRFVDSEQVRFSAYYQRAWDDCTKLRQTQTLEAERRMPFDRILIRRFAHLFPARAGDDGGEGVLSRRIIPGFTLAIDKMIGPTLRAQCHDKCEAILERHAVSGEGAAWDSVYHDPEAKALVNDVLMVVAHYFTGFDKRRAWFLEIVNSHLAPVPKGEADEYFLLGESGFSALMRALFADLATKARTNPRGVANRWGEGAAAALNVFILRLDGFGL